jgi:hypothetical protein
LVLLLGRVLLGRAGCDVLGRRGGLVLRRRPGLLLEGRALLLRLVRIGHGCLDLHGLVPEG